MYIIVATISIPVKTMINIVSVLIISNIMEPPIITSRNGYAMVNCYFITKKR